jgi:hypothetical protein
LLAAKLVVVAFVIVALSEVRFRILATVAKKLERTFSQEMVEVEIVVVPKVVVPELNVPVTKLFPTDKLPVVVALVPVELPDPSTR